MKRDFSQLGRETFDLLIIGGGITGACIARDAARRGLSVALVEKRDFSSATSSGSSKLVHGGLRYLRKLEIGLVRESLAERRIWQRIAPHQVRPLPFLLPANKSTKGTLGVGLTLYDLLSYDRNRLNDPDQHMSAHKWYKPDAVRALEPVLGNQEMDGAFLYYDCQMRSPDRLAFECLQDAVAFGAVVVNYAKAESFLRDEDKILGANVTDQISGATQSVRAQITLNAAGPWADDLLDLATHGDSRRDLLRSKGIHLITRGLTRDHAVTITIPEQMGGGHLFLLPWRGQTIIGTTDTAYEASPDDLSVAETEIASYLTLINAAVPGANLTRDDVTHAYAGLRPLIQDKGEDGNPYNASRKSEVVDHEEEDDLKGFFSAIGGKWTTSRHMAEECVYKLCRKLDREIAPCATDVKPLPGGRMDRLSTFLDEERTRRPDLPQRNFEEIALTYGTESGAIYGLLEENPALNQSFTPMRGEIAAQVVHAARSEMAQTLEDAVFRRTGLGTLGHPGRDALTYAADLIGTELGWDEVKKAEELKAVQRLFFAEGGKSA